MRSSRPRVWRACALALGTALPCGPAVLAQSPASPVLADPGAASRWIVTFTERSFDLDGLRAAIVARTEATAAAIVRDLEDRVRADQAEFAARVEALRGRVTKQYWIINGCAVELPREAAAELRALPGVAAVYEDTPRRPGAAPIKASTDTNNHRTDLVQALGVKGVGLTVAALDTGFDEDMGGSGKPHHTFFVNGDPNNTLGGGIGGSRMLVNTKVGMLPADNAMSHGTRVSSVAIGARWNTTAQSDDGHAPLAHFAGYSLSDDVSGNSFLSTMVLAWQQVVADAARLKTRVANISYEGTATPGYPEQQAMDAAAWTADLVIAAMAGNVATNNPYRQGALNIVPVGSVSTNGHVASPFSSRGPVGGRLYPLLAANGESIVTPTIDTAASQVTSTGTSFSAPQVAGAAALFRSVHTTASAEETRAALLATTEDIAAANAGNLDAIGHGYLRVDRLIELAGGKGLVQRGTVGVVSPFSQLTARVTGGKEHVVALSWSRQSVMSTTWANLDLTVRQNGKELGSAKNIVDVNERIVFQAPATGDVFIEVSAVSFEPGTVTQPFGVALVEATDQQPVAAIASFGSGCPAGRQASGITQIEPNGLGSTAFGNGSSDLLLGNVPHRTQHWYDITTGPLGAFHASAMAVRHDDTATPSALRYWVEIDVDLGLTPRPPTGMTTSFAASYGTWAPTRVVNRRRVVLPRQAAPNQDPKNWTIVIPFDQLFHRVYDLFPGGPVGSQRLIVDVRRYDSSVGAQTIPYQLDAVTGGNLASTLFAPSPTATTGIVMAGMATVVGMIDQAALGAPIIPLIDTGAALPKIGTTYPVNVSGTVPASPVLLATGLSNSQLGPLALPLALAPFGGDGCYLFTSQEVLSAQVSGPSGTTSFPVWVPPNPALFGVQLFHQALTANAAANALGVATSNGLAATLGR